MAEGPVVESRPGRTGNLLFSHRKPSAMHGQPLAPHCWALPLHRKHPLPHRKPLTDALPRTAAGLSLPGRVRQACPGDEQAQCALG